MIEKNKTEDWIILSTGRKLYVNKGIIGISPYDNDIYYGYDGHLYEENGEWTREEPDLEHPIFVEERLEISYHMRDLWNEKIDKLEKLRCPWIKGDPEKEGFYWVLTKEGKEQPAKFIIQSNSYHGVWRANHKKIEVLGYKFCPGSFCEEEE